MVFAWFSQLPLICYGNPIQENINTSQNQLRQPLFFHTKTDFIVYLVGINYSTLVQSNPFIWVGRHISAMVGCIKNLRPLYEVQLLETFQIQQLDLHYSALSLGNVKKDRLYAGPFWRFRERAHCKRYQKKVTETKAEKILDRTLKMAFFTPLFLGFTTIIISYWFFIWYFYERISKKQLAKMYQVDLRISQSGRFWWPLFDSNFRTVKGIFGWNQLCQKIFTSFGNEMSKKFCNYLWRFWCTKETLSPGQRIFFALNFI